VPEAQVEPPVEVLPVMVVGHPTKDGNRTFVQFMCCDVELETLAWHVFS
jgi:hypothetical protein